MAATKKALSDSAARIRQAQDELRAGLAALRERVAKLKTERDAVTNHPVLADLAFQRVDAFVAEGSARLRSHGVEIERFLLPPSVYRPPDALGFERLLAFLAPLIAQAMKAELATRASGEAMAEDERVDQLARLDRDLLDAELSEESIVRLAEKSGFSITRRGDADPRAVLADDRELP